MLLVYQPVPDVAWDSVQTLTGAVRFGPLVRGVHYWSANLLIAVVLLHVARVVLTGGYHRPRRLNWAVGSQYSYSWCWPRRSPAICFPGISGRTGP